MKNVYISYKERAGKTALLMQLRVRAKEMPIIRALDKKGKQEQKGFRYSRNRAVLAALKAYTEEK